MAKHKHPPICDNRKCYFCDLQISDARSSKRKCRSVIELHHIVEKENGGDNHPRNLIPVCSNHHSMIHEGWIVIKRWCFTTGGWKLHWIDASGNERFGCPDEPYYPEEMLANQHPPPKKESQ